MADETQEAERQLSPTESLLNETADGVIAITNLRPVENRGALKANFTTLIGGTVALNQCQYFEGPTGAYVSVPSNTNYRDGKRTYVKTGVFHKSVNARLTDVVRKELAKLAPPPKPVIPA